MSAQGIAKKHGAALRRWHQSTQRCAAGVSLTEVGPLLFVLFLLLTFPLLNLATVSLRYTFVVTASRDACAAAAQASTFQNNGSSGSISAVNLANQVARRELGAFNGIKFKSVTTAILITNVATKALTRQTTPLAQPADTSQSLYNIEVTVAAQVNPLISYGTGQLLSVPGLSAPMDVSVVSQRYSENPQGLNQ